MERLLKAREMAAIIGVTADTLRAWVKQNPTLPHFRPTAKSLRFRPQELLDWLQQQTRKEEQCNS